MFFQKLKNIREYSIKNLFLAFMVLIMVVNLAAFFYNTIYIDRVLRNQYYENMNKTLNVYRREVSAELSTVSSYLNTLSSNNGNFSIINTSNNEIQHYKSLLDIRRTLETALPMLTGIDGLSCYSRVTGDYIYSLNNSLSYSYATTRRREFRTMQDDNFRADLPYYIWTLIRINDDYYFEYLLPSGKNILAAWVRLDGIRSAITRALDDGTQIEFVDKEGRVISSTAYADSLFESSDAPASYRDEDGQNYIVTLSSFPGSTCQIIALTPAEIVDNHSRPILFPQLLIIGAVILATVLLMIIITHVLNIPFAMIRQQIVRLQQTSGEYPALPQTRSHWKEFNEISEAFHNLNHEIADLKIDIYEKELEQKSLELRHLRAQVAPHFLINCLSTISYLSTSDDENSRSLLLMMLDSLSNHLRYTLSDNKEATLAQEKHYMENYLQLSMIRFPGCLSYEIDIPSVYDSVSVFPMMLLTLTENSIKHNRIMGRSLSLRIVAHAEELDGQTFLHFIHTDTGKGYDPAQLEELNALTRLEISEKIRNGHNIGLYNIAKTLSLTFPGKSYIHFENTEDGGARTDLWIPLDEKGV